MAARGSRPLSAAAAGLAAPCGGSAGWVGAVGCAFQRALFLPLSAVTAPGVPLTALLPAQMDPKFLRNQRKAKRKQDALKKSGVITKKITFFPKAPQA